MNVTEVAVLPVNCKNKLLPLVTSAAKANQPLGAVGKLIVPFAAPPVPTTTLKQNVLDAVTVGPVPNPLEIVGRVVEATKLLPIDKLLALYGEYKGLPL